MTRARHLGAGPALRRSGTGPLGHGRRLAALIPGAELLELDDCGTLIPVDRPQALSAAVREFAAAHPA